MPNQGDPIACPCDPVRPGGLTQNPPSPEPFLFPAHQSPANQPYAGRPREEKKAVAKEGDVPLNQPSCPSLVFPPFPSFRSYLEASPARPHPQTFGIASDRISNPRLVNFFFSFFNLTTGIFPRERSDRIPHSIDKMAQSKVRRSSVHDFRPPPQLLVMLRSMQSQQISSPTRGDPASLAAHCFSRFLRMLTVSQFTTIAVPTRVQTGGCRRRWCR